MLRELMHGIPASWTDALEGELSKPYAEKLSSFLSGELDAGKRVYPDRKEIFRALHLTPLEDVRVVIIGQDPYHGEGQAHGLSFSVREGVALPPSLRNIFKELQSDMGIGNASHGCLEGWAKQGVLLLNSVLTVEHSAAASHAGKGWEDLTDAMILAVNERRDGVVFVLWGAYAQKKASFVDVGRHKVLQSAHPSPLAARRGFFGSKPFSEINRFLVGKGESPIDWSVS